MTHADYLDLLAGEALGGLDAPEVAALRVHAVDCAECAAESERLDDVMVDLALAAPPRRPSSGLEARILAAIAAEPGIGSRPVVAAPVAKAPSAGPRSWLGWLGRPRLAMAAFALALLLGASSVILGLRAGDLQRTIATQNAALAVLADPDHIEAPLAPDPSVPGAAAVAVYLPDSDQAYIMVTGLPATPSDRVYQLWYADAAGVHPLGTYRYDGTGTFVAPFGVDLGASSAAMVTLEPPGGAVGEPGPQVVFGELPTSEG